MEPHADCISVTANPLVPIENDWQDYYKDIPTLANNLDVVIKNPGIFPTSELVKINPQLFSFFGKLPAYSQINEECIAPYFPPSQDQNLKRLTKKHGCKYLMSTSTVSSVLSHIYYAVSNHKSPHFSGLSQAYDNEPLKFMVSQRKPNTVFVTQIDEGGEVFSIDSDSGFMEPSNMVLLKMGKYMEKMMTTPHEEFNDYYVLDLRTNKPKRDLTEEMKQEMLQEDYFRYMRSGKMFLRSQIDTRGVDMDGNEIVFELKTRASAPMRYDITNYIDFLDYEIGKYRGQF